MDYNPREIENKWKKWWDENEVYKVSNDSGMPKFYVLDMFPYPSGSGLHVGHPLGYIASDIVSRFMRMKGFNVLHPMGFDAFGLPAEQYAIQTGVHPAVSTEKNIIRYRAQLENLGFSFDWSREVRTSDPGYYKWTQWVFLQLFNNYYCQEENLAQPISELTAIFETKGNAQVHAANSQEGTFTAEEWNAMTPKQRDDVLMNYRLAYRKMTYVWWCEELGTVLANDEVKDGFSERGGHPVERKPMLQWSLRITAYAERLLNDLADIEFSDSMTKMQTNWIGRSEGAQMFFDLHGFEEKLEIFTTRPDTIFGATFMVLAPEHDLVQEITTGAQRREIEDYLAYVNTRSERDRIAETKEVSGAFTGAFAINPFNGDKIPIWIAEYVLKDYGTGAIMAVPADDERDHRFAEKFSLPVVQIIDKSEHPGATIEDKVGKMINSDFLNGMEVPDAIEAILQKMEAQKIGTRRVNYKLRDAIYSRQRYWGEPFPIVYDQDGVAHALPENELPLELPELDDFKPTSSGEAPLARAKDWINLPDGWKRETDTMPGFAGSSWYYLRYMDARNDEAFASQKALNYWRDVDLYVGGTEHAVGHLMYSRFWHKFLYDKGLVPTKEPYKKLMNQGMIQGVSEKLYRLNSIEFAKIKLSKKLKRDIKNKEILFEPTIGGVKFDFKIESKNVLIKVERLSNISNFKTSLQNFFVSQYKVAIIPADDILENTKSVIENLDDFIAGKTDTFQTKLEKEFDWLIQAEIRNKNVQYYPSGSSNIDISIVKDGVVNVIDLKQTTKVFENPRFYNRNKDKKFTISEVEKMSKSKFNVINPDDVVEQYGADCFRMYEMFIGPIEQAKPWDTKGIDGVSKFLRKLWSLFFDKQGQFSVSEDAPEKEELKILHTCLKKVSEDIERFSFNTCVSGFMICTNDLRSRNCNKRAILESLVKALAPFAPHASEELWHRLGHTSSVCTADFPAVVESHLVEDMVKYPVSINGKKRDLVELPAGLPVKDLENRALELDAVKKWTDGKTVRKVIVVPGRMINVVVG
jgi:leucyl-tRNA synthetase